MVREIATLGGRQRPALGKHLRERDDGGHLLGRQQAGGRGPLQPWPGEARDELEEAPGPPGDEQRDRTQAEDEPLEESAPRHGKADRLRGPSG